MKNFIKLLFFFTLFYSSAYAANPDFSITKSSPVTLVNQSSSLSYNLVVTNNTGNADADNVVVTDTLKAGMTFVSYSYVKDEPSKGGEWSCSSAGSPVVVTCSTPEAYRGDFTTITLNVTSPTSTVVGAVTFNNDANVTYDLVDPDMTNNTSNIVTVTLNRPPTAVNDTFSTASHTAVSGNVLTDPVTYDSDLDGDTFSVTNPGTYTLNFGELIISSTGAFTYTPGYFTGETDSFTYTATDNHGASSTATLQIQIGSACSDTGLNASDRDFCLRKQTVLFGDMVTIGNTLVVAPDSQPANTTNRLTYCSSYTTGSFLDTSGTTDNQGLYLCSYRPDSYLNATSAELITSPGRTIKWAGLYLQSVVNRTNSSDLSNMDVKIKHSSDSGYISAGSPTVINYGNYVTTNSTNYDNYSAFIDITSKINTWSDGMITVANVPVTTDVLYGGDSIIGKFGAWSLVVVYEDTDLPLKSLSIYDGWKKITSTTGKTVTVDNFYTPTTGDINSTVSVFVGEGDDNRDGDKFRVGTTDLGTPSNAFDSKIVTTGTRLPEVENNQGIDIKTYQIGTAGYDLLANSANSISFTFSNGSPYDYFYPSMLAFSTEVYSPKMCYYENLYDSTDTLLSDGDLVAKGSTIHARVLLKNDENEPAENVLFYKDFESTFPYIANSTGLNNTGNPDISSTTTAVTDALDGDEFQYATAIDQFALNVGTGATSTLGGDFDYNQTVLIDYNATANFDGNRSLIYKIAYTMPTIGYTYDGELAKCDDFNSTFGVIPSNPTQSASVDIADDYSGTGVSYDSWIKTKVSAQPGITLKAVYLGSDSSSPVPQAYSPGDSSTLTILYKLADMSAGGTCQNAPTVNLNTAPGNNDPVVSLISDGAISATSNPFIVAYVELGTTPLSQKNLKVKYKTVDFSSLIDTAGITCANHSSTNGGIKGIPQCLTSASLNSQAIANYITVFGQDAYDSCFTQNGEPCLSNHGGIGASPYDHEYGCFECSIGAFPYTCSNDDFAIRPDKLSISATSSHMPDLMRSAEQYNTTVNAYDYSSVTNSANYTFTNANNVFDINTTKYNKNAVVDATMAGNASFGSTAFNMLSGKSDLSGSSEVVGLKFDDVGTINIRIEDKIWAAVDADDTPADCTANGSYVCGDLNATFIPDHFDFNGSIITNNDDTADTFTYIANEIDQMAARINANIRALNKDNNITSNFAPFPLYENPVTVIPTVVKSTYAYPDANETSITNQTLGFGAGVKNIPSTETNTSTRLRFNFQRDVNMSVNPFIVDGSDLNITVTSTYTSSLATAGTALIQGDLNGSMDGNSTFIYGRTNARRHTFVGSSGTAFIYYEAYCSDTTGVCDKTLLPSGADSNSTNDPRWFKNASHTSTIDGETGNIDQKSGATLVTAGALDNSVQGQTTTLLTYTGTSYPYKTTMENNASLWLIYNKYNINDTTNEFEVEFHDNNNSWAGAHETNTTTNQDASNRTNRRSMW